MQCVGHKMEFGVMPNQHGLNLWHVQIGTYLVVLKTVGSRLFRSENIMWSNKALPVQSTQPLKMEMFCGYNALSEPHY